MWINSKAVPPVCRPPTGQLHFRRLHTLIQSRDSLDVPDIWLPLRAKNRGVIRRAGHTEAAVDLARLAGLYPAGALIEIMNEDGTMARLPELIELSKKFGLKIISIEDLIAYRLKTESLVEKGEKVNMPTSHGYFKLNSFPSAIERIGACGSYKR